MFYKILDASILQTQHRFFSSLPYSVFRLSLMNKKKTQQNIKIVINRFKYRGGVMALRAPKHFKAGKQFYSTSKRSVIVTCKNNAIDKTNKLKKNEVIKNLTIFQLYQIAKNLSNNNPVNIPLSITKSKTLEVRISFKIKKLI